MSEILAQAETILFDILNYHSYMFDIWKDKDTWKVIFLKH